MPGYPIFFCLALGIRLCTSNLHSLHFSVWLLFLIQFNALVVSLTNCSGSRLSAAVCRADGGLRAVWVFGQLGRFFLLLFGHFVNFLTLKSVSPVFVLILKNSFFHFQFVLKISAKFCYFIAQLPGFSPRKFNLTLFRGVFHHRISGVMANLPPLIFL